MGFMSDTEWELGPQDDDLETPPGSPNLAATQAQAIADNLPSNFLEQHGRTVRDYAALCCEEFELMDVDRDDVLKTSQLHSHLISVRQYARMVALDRRVQRLIVDSFLDSTEFKDHITRRVQFTFLDAEVPFYVRGATARLIQHMQLNPASWHIPAVVHANFLTSKAFWKAVGAVASNFRGDMRRKIRRSIADKSDIGALARKLCIKGYQPTTAHWRRFALLRDYMNDWDKLPVKPGKSRRAPYWPFIDSKLDKLRERCKQSTDRDTEKALKDSLKAAVERDQQRYKGPASGTTKLPSKVHIPGWQKDHAKAVQEMAAYTVEAGPEDDVDDDDDEEEDVIGQPRVPNGGEIEAERGNPEAPDAGSTSAATPERLEGAPTGRVLVPGTQETSRSTSPAGDVTDGPEPQTPDPSSGTLGRDIQPGWTGGSLPDRRQRPPHASRSPVARPPATRSRRS